MSLLMAAIAVSSCAAGTEHSWHGEFTARLEGAAGSIEEALDAMHPDMSGFDYLQIFPKLSERQEFKDALIKELDPPGGCEEVQEKGEQAIKRSGGLSRGLPQNLTPLLVRKLPSLLEEEIAELKTIEGEAKTCAAR